MEINTMLLIGTTAASGIIAIDKLIHRFEKRQDDTEHRIDGAPSLRANVDQLRQQYEDLKTGWRRILDDYRADYEKDRMEDEKLRMQRSKDLAHTLEMQMRSIQELHEKASRFGTEQQKTVGDISVRLRLAEDRIDANAKRLDWLESRFYRSIDNDRRHRDEFRVPDRRGK